MWTGSKFETFCTGHYPLVSYKKYVYGFNCVPTKREQIHVWILCVSTFSFVHSVNRISMGDGINEVPFLREGTNLHWSVLLAGYSFYLSLLHILGTYRYLKLSILLFLYQIWLKTTNELKNKVTVPTCKSLFHSTHKLKKRKTCC